MGVCPRDHFWCQGDPKVPQGRAMLGSLGVFVGLTPFGDCSAPRVATGATEGKVEEGGRMGGVSGTRKTEDAEARKTQLRKEAKEGCNENP